MFSFFSDVQGYDLITKDIEKLIAKGGPAAARSGLSKGMTIIARGIRKSIPPKLKSVKKTVGQRFITDKDKNAKLPKGVFGAKVGLGVGKKTKPKQERESKPGVGIAKENIHWWELGTKERKWKTISGQSTGKMPKGPPVVREGFHATKSEARRAIIAAMKKKIKDQAKKRKARAKAKRAKGK